MQRILASKTVLKTKLFTVDEVSVEFPNAIQATHHVVKRVPAVYIFPLTPQYELYLVREDSYITQDTVLQAPAGFIENNENPLQAAKRELREETGIIAGQWEEFAKLELAKSSLDAKTHLFLAKDLEIGVAIPEETENIEIIKIPLAEAVKKVMSGEIRKASVVAGILMLDRLKSEKRL